MFRLALLPILVFPVSADTFLTSTVTPISGRSRFNQAMKTSIAIVVALLTAAASTNANVNIGATTGSVGKHPVNGAAVEARPAGFLVGFALGDFVADKNFNPQAIGKAGVINQVTLHGPHWYTKNGFGDGFFIASIKLDVPITAAQYRTIIDLTNKHGKEQVFFKFSASQEPHKEVDFRGKLLGYYFVKHAERDGFVDNLNKNGDAPGFVTIL